MSITRGGQVLQLKTGDLVVRIEGQDGMVALDGGGGVAFDAGEAGKAVEQIRARAETIEQRLQRARRWPVVGSRRENSAFSLRRRSRS